MQDGVPDRWAVEWGEDRRGRFMAFGVGDVSHRLRWVPAGTFLMGSPQGEAGRDADEVRHEVTLTRGFWLGETPVTQDIWHAVTGANPSGFVHPRRPVERVGWADCVAFCVALNERAPGLGSRLPTEAEWEHACRAGTTSATHGGDLTLRGTRDAPELDAIAWYGGNSGVDFDLPEGQDSASWPQKQYPHTRAGSRIVQARLPNPWGLHDMLGNVWEWCSDCYGPLGAGPAVDPHGPDSGDDRIARGGSWGSFARYVRAAYRRRFPPEVRRVDLGFRLARGQDPLALPGAEPRAPRSGA